MPLHNGFLLAWRVWLRVEAPIRNSRERRFSAPTYGVEVALDHLDSHLYSLGLAIIDGENFANQTSEELSELDRLSCELESLGLTADEKKTFDECIAADRALLLEINKLALRNDGEAK